MYIRQISVFIENRAGRLETVARLLGENKVNIRALSLADTSDFGILRLIVDKPDAAAEILKKHNFTIRLTEAVAVEIPDVPGGLAGVLSILGKRGINVEYMYAFVEKSQDKAVLVFRFDDIQAAVTALQEGGIRLLPEKELIEM